MKKIIWIVIICTALWFMFLGPSLMPDDFAMVGFPIFLLGMAIILITRKKKDEQQQ